MALLEADVSFKVVKGFVARVRERAVGVDVLESLTPAQQVVKIVHDELLERIQATSQARSASHRRHPPWSCSSAYKARVRRPPPRSSPST